MIRYQMSEREITKGDHLSHHFCVDTFGNNFDLDTTHYVIDQELSKIDIDLLDYERAITVESKGNFLHVSCLRKSIEEYMRESVRNYFNINVDFPVIYFTKKIPFTYNFKCGFYLNTYKKFNSVYFKKTLSTIKLLKGLYYDIILAGDFTGDGRFIDESINIEVMPVQSKETYFKIRDILSNNFEIDNFYFSDKLFDNYSLDKFHFHFKIKYSGDDTIVKFYHTLPHNPYINYYDNEKNFR